jgi:hypothetical protein
MGSEDGTKTAQPSNSLLLGLSSQAACPEIFQFRAYEFREMMHSKSGLGGHNTQLFTGNVIVETAHSDGNLRIFPLHFQRAVHWLLHKSKKHFKFSLFQTKSTNIHF